MYVLIQMLELIGLRRVDNDDRRCLPTNKDPFLEATLSGEVERDRPTIIASR